MPSAILPKPVPATSSALRQLAENTWRRRRLVCGAGFAAFLLPAAMGVALAPRYVSHSTMLMLLGSEYTVRTEAGAGTTSNTAFDPDHILGTESAILSSDDLARDVLTEIGIARLYPKLVERPDPLHRLIAAIRDVPNTILYLAGLARRHGRADPMELATGIFEDKLDIEPSKTANVITLGFTHRDPVLARRVLRVLERDYLDRRRVLYQQQRTGAMREKLVSLRAALEAAERRLADYRARHALPDYTTQLDILLHEQGDLGHEIDEARRTIASDGSRMTILREQLGHLPEMIEAGVDLNGDGRTASLRDSLDGLRARQAATLSRYRSDSDFARDLGEQINTRSSELRAVATSGAGVAGPSATHSVRNPSRDAVLGNLLATESELRATEAALVSDQQAARSIRDRIAALDENQRVLDQLGNDRDVALDASRSLASSLATQESIEAVEARSLPSVRIAEAPGLPIRPRPIPLLLGIAGMFAGLATTAGTALLLHAFRRTLLFADEIEQVGVLVLADVPKGDRLAGLPPIVPWPA